MIQRGYGQGDCCGTKDGGQEMFVMMMPTTFKVGDTADCKINTEPARLTWRDEGTLVIEPDDV
jgi:hypothetical protein